MTRTLAVVGVAIMVAAPSVAVARPVPIVSLSASPARLVFAGEGSARVELANRGPTPVVVAVAKRSLRLDVRGRPVLVARARPYARDPAAWLSVQPQELVIPPRATTFADVAVRTPTTAEPGDHHAVILFATRAATTGTVGVRMRLGVRAVVRVAGPLVRELVVERVRVRRRGARRVVEIAVANRGNVTETLARGELEVAILARGRVVARLRTSRRELLPHSRSLLASTYRGPVRGRALVRVELRGRARVFRVRL